MNRKGSEGGRPYQARLKQRDANAAFFGLDSEEEGEGSESTNTSRPQSSIGARSVVGGSEDDRSSVNTTTAVDSSQMRESLFQHTEPDSTHRRMMSGAKPVEPEVVEEVPPLLSPLFDSNLESFVIKGAKIINDDGVSELDVLLSDGKICEIGSDVSSPPGSIVIDGNGKYLIPGGIDLSVNLQSLDGYPTKADDVLSGSKAALLGGTTTLMMQLKNYENAEKCLCNFTFSLPQESQKTTFNGSTFWNVDLSWDRNKLIQTFEEANEAGAVIIATPVDFRLSDYKKKKIKNFSPETHLEIYSEELEEKAISLACNLSKEIGTPLIIASPSTKTATKLIRECGAIGTVGIASLIPGIGDKIYDKNWHLAASVVTTPPIRGKESETALWNGIKSGIYPIIVSNHETYTMASKSSDPSRIPSGVNGIEERLSLLWEEVRNGKISQEEFVRLTSSSSAKAIGVYPSKGRIAVGSDADVVLWNPSLTRTISVKNQASQSDINVFHGIRIHGSPEVVIRGGKVLVHNQILNPDGHAGSFVECKPFSKMFYGLTTETEPEKVDRTVVVTPVVKKVTPTPAPVPEGFGLTACRKGSDLNPVMNKKLGIYQRPCSAHGIRNQQDSTFSLMGPKGGVTSPDDMPRKSVKVCAPPGGGGTGGFW